jgi:hypothetical protein
MKTNSNKHSIFPRFSLIYPPKFHQFAAISWGKPDLRWVRVWR